MKLVFAKKPLSELKAQTQNSMQITEDIHRNFCISSLNLCPFPLESRDARDADSSYYHAQTYQTAI